MFFGSQFFLLTIIQILKINSLNLNKELPEQVKTDQRDENLFYYEDVEQNSLRTLSTHNTIFKNNQKYYENTNPNLKFNVFDKMLSDEMLSIQQHFYEKDIQFSAPFIQTTSKNNVRTPTLEIKQKWYLEEFVPQTMTTNNNLNLENTKRDINNLTELLDNHSLNTSYFSETKNFTKSYERIEKVAEITINKEKVIDLRSLYRNLPSLITTKICTCMNTNPSSTCSHHCTGPEIINRHKNPLRSDDTKKVHKKRCTRHQENCVHDGANMPSQYPKATPPTPSIKMTIPPNPPYYPLYPTYFIGITTVIPVLNAYYYTEAQNSSTLSKNRKHSNRKVKHKGDIDKKESVYDEYSEAASYYTSTGKANHELFHVELGVSEFVTDETVDVSKIKKIKINHRMYDEENNKFVNNIVEDLKAHYSEVVIKECFCSTSSQKLSVLVSLCCFILVLVF